MGFWSRPKLIKAAAVSVYLLLGFLQLLAWFFFSYQNAPDIVFGFTLLSLTALMTYVWEPFLLVYIFSFVLLPVFYVAVAAGLERKSRIALSLALISNLLTINANVIWIRIYGTSPRSQVTLEGLVFNLVVLPILILYWLMIIKEKPSQ